MILGKAKIERASLKLKIDVIYASELISDDLNSDILSAVLQ